MNDYDELEIEMSASKVLDTVAMHRTRFQKSYKLALQAFDKQAQAYQKKYDEWRTKSGVADKQPIPPPKPEDKTKDYDLYVDMLSMHIAFWKDGGVEDASLDIKISETLFRRLILDKWDWTFRHHDTLMFYAHAAGGSGGKVLANMAASYDQ